MPEASASIARALTSSEHGVITHLVSAVDPAERGEAINEKGSQIQLPAILTRAVVGRKGVVVVVEAFADRSESDEEVLGWVDISVIGLVTPHVGSAVDEPGYV